MKASWMTLWVIFQMSKILCWTMQLLSMQECLGFKAFWAILWKGNILFCMKLSIVGWQGEIEWVCTFPCRPASLVASWVASWCKALGQEISDLLATMLVLSERIMQRFARMLQSLHHPPASFLTTCTLCIGSEKPFGVHWTLDMIGNNNVGSLHRFWVSCIRYHLSS